MPVSILSVLLLVVALIGLTGCAGAEEPDSSGTIGTGKVADLQFTSTTAAGETFDGRRLEGKPAVLWFWAPWCPTCRAQSGGVIALAEAHGDRLNVVGVGGLDDAAAVRDFAEEVPEIIQLIDPEGKVWRHFGVTAQSTYTVIDADGEIVAEGYLDDGELADLVGRVVD